MPQMVFMRSEFNSHSMSESSSWIVFFVGAIQPSAEDIRHVFESPCDEHGDFDDGVSSQEVGEIRQISAEEMEAFFQHQFINAQVIDIAKGESGWWDNKSKSVKWEIDSDFQFVSAR